MKYGNPPKELGKFDLDVGQMMFYLYLPIKMKATYSWELPTRLKIFNPLIRKVYMDMGDDWLDSYVYMTAKTMYVDKSSPGNRPGYHVDGYGSNGDLNYLWMDMNPTQFCVQKFHDIPDDDIESMKELTRQAKTIVTYPLKTLLKLDETVVHRVDPNAQSGVRTFAKITVSKHKFASKGNSINYKLNYNWQIKDRNILQRNIDHGK